MTTLLDHPRVGVGGVALRDDELLLIRRGKPPSKGLWSLPGGHLELGEDLRGAVVREVLEETGLEVVVDGFLGWVERMDLSADPPYHFVILDFSVVVLDPFATPVAGGDALEAAWIPLGDLGEYQLAQGVGDFLTDHGVLPVDTLDA